jgi:hypothetical protein
LGYGAQSPCEFRKINDKAHRIAKGEAAKIRRAAEIKDKAGLIAMYAEAHIANLKRVGRCNGEEAKGDEKKKVTHGFILTLLIRRGKAEICLGAAIILFL